MQITNIFRSTLGSDPDLQSDPARRRAGRKAIRLVLQRSNFPWFESNSTALLSLFFYGMGGAIYANPTDYSSVSKSDQLA